MYLSASSGQPPCPPGLSSCRDRFPPSSWRHSHHSSAAAADTGLLEWDKDYAKQAEGWCPPSLRSTGYHTDKNDIQSRTLFLSISGCLKNPIPMISSVACFILNSWLGRPQSLRKPIPPTRGLTPSKRTLATLVSSPLPHPTCPDLWRCWVLNQLSTKLCRLVRTVAENRS